MINVCTPARKQGIKRLARRSYKSLATTMASTPDMLQSVLNEICRKIRYEMKELSSEASDSVLRDNVEAVKQFHWDTIRMELEKMLPTLMTFLRNLLPKSSQRIPLICVIASQLLKARHQRMGLVQRAISIMLYGNGSHKQVSSALWSLWLEPSQLMWSVWWFGAPRALWQCVLRAATTSNYLSFRYLGICSPSTCACRIRAH